MKKIISALISLMLLVQPVFAVANTKNENSNRFFSLTDLHFNPYNTCQKGVTPCPVIEELRQAQASQWPTILAKYETKLVGYGTDSNSMLINAALSASSWWASQQHTDFVVVMGDLLGHNFKKNYLAYSSDTTGEHYQEFVKTTMQYLTQQIAASFPKTDVYMAVGNNDSYTDDYGSEPNGAFYQDMSVLWSGLIKNKNNQSIMQQEFSTAGYYGVDIANNLHLIVLNSVLFSNKAQGTHVDDAAKAELDWLQNELNTVKANNQKAMIVMHIPAGIDVFATLHPKTGTTPTIVELWKSQYTPTFEAILNQNASNIMGVFAGHFHADWFQVIGDIPVIGTPGVSPQFGNKPGFKVFRYGADSLNLQDAETDICDLTVPGPMGMWYTEYFFYSTYQSLCQPGSDCGMFDEMKNLPISGDLTNKYKLFYMDSTTPIADKDWQYYWCGMHTTRADEYQSCLSTTTPTPVHH